MKRDHPDVIELRGPTPLPAPASEVVRVLAPLVTEARLARMEAVVAQRTRSLVPVLEDLADPHNGAAVLRSADAFGCHEVHVIEHRHPFAVSHRVTRGTHRWLELVRHRSTASCLEHLGAQGYQVFVAAMDGTLTPEDLAQVPKAAIVFGNEHRGASEAVRRAAAGTYAIPMVGFVESLNVSVSAALLLYAATRGRSGDLDPRDQQQWWARALYHSVRRAPDILRALPAR